jgi:hypothetical protein
MKITAAIIVLALGVGGCSVGKGVGAASGFIYEYGCSKNGDYGTQSDGGAPLAPAPYDLQPSFFAGEIIDDLREYSAGSEPRSNRLIIRLQRSGKQIELNDVLTFDVSSSYEVARCVRGRVLADGTPDWDQANCYRASDQAPGRMRVQYDSDVHVALTLHATCTANLVASAVSRPVPPSYATSPNPVVANGAWDAWVEFQEFGTASQYNLEPQGRTFVEPTFRVDYGQRIYATSFFLTLTDDNVVSAAIAGRPLPEPQVGGTLGGDPTTGRFDFDVQRGQSAQFFP